MLFIPVSGSHGSGEVQRCRLLAEAAQARWPEAAPHFLLAAGTPGVPWPTTVLTASPTRAVVEVVAAIERLKPAVVLFDGNTRVAALRAARRVGARVVLLSSRTSARDRGFRWRRMAQLDEHWLVGADLLAAGGWRERWARRWHRQVVVRRFATLFAPPAEVDPLLQRLGVHPPYAVVCPGGGRHPIDGSTAAERFGEAAQRVAARGLATIAVAAPARPPATHVESLPNADLMGLLAHAEVALISGGSLLVQALALGTATVALPLQEEQAARVRWLAGTGTVVTAPSSSAEALADAVLALQADPAQRHHLRQRCAALGLSNGLPGCAQALVDLAKGLSAGAAARRVGDQPPFPPV